MKQKTKIIRPGFRVISSDIDGFDSLADFALDLRCSWNHEADEIWYRQDPDLWNLTRNPWEVLQTVSADQFKKVMSDPLFRKKVDDLKKSKEQVMSGPAWFQKKFPKSTLTDVAFFSMEYMLSESLPIYSGGLGNVAGDQLKTASDLGVPIVGVGLLYQQGYFRQEIDKNGEQQALFPYNDPGQLPVIPLRHSNGEWLRLEIELPGYSVWLRAWQVQVGRIKLYLLDSNNPANLPAHRGITSELYGGGFELRLKQEMVLGIGGWRLLHALGINPIRGSGSVNGVSRLHGEVSRNLFGPLFPKWPINEVPVGHITNGVHMPTWDSKEADDIWTKACGKDRWLGMNKSIGKDIRKITDEELWLMRTNANKALIHFVSEHLPKQLLGSGYSPDSAERIKNLFDPDILTLGFARRFATYKRPNLLLHDPKRLLRLLINPKFPVQLIISGKAHPADQEGKNLIKEWIQFIRQKDIRPPVIFISDYDMHISENLVQGVDVWINTPRRPWEASGTSGMKVLVNGGINLSELDDWWAEAYSPEVGWALGDGKEHSDDRAIDAIEAEQLYTILEQQVIPEFYNRIEKGIPTTWISRMRESMAQLTPQFSADRTVREYTEQHYLPAAKAFLERTANKGEMAKKIVQVELFANGINGEAPLVLKMNQGSKLEDSKNGYQYKISVPATRPEADYTLRIIPNLPGVLTPLETALIHWQR